jgi:hypothetical protein
MSEGNKGKIESVREPEGAAEPKVEMPEEPEAEMGKRTRGKGAGGKRAGREDLRLAMDVKEPPAAALEAGKKARGEAGDGGQESGGDLVTLVREVVQLLREIKENQQNQQGGPFLG